MGCPPAKEAELLKVTDVAVTFKLEPLSIVGIPDPETSSVDPSKVKLDSPSKVLAVPDPVITLLFALLFIVANVGCDPKTDFDP